MAATSPNERRWGADAKNDPVAGSAARRLGLAPKYVEKLLRRNGGIGARCAELIRAFRALGDDVRLERFFAPIRAAYENRNPQPLTPELAQWANEADSAEERCELKFWQTRSDKDLSMDIRALDTEIARQIVLRDALAGEEQRRMERQS
jgi:hypothetical protein